MAHGSNQWGLLGQMNPDPYLTRYGSRPVTFTKGGDREVVRFNFYKYSYHVNQ